MKKIIFYSLTSIAIAIITGCDSSVKDFVQGATPPSTSQPSLSPASTSKIKVSPANVDISHTNGAIKGNISLTNRTYLAGPDMAVNLTINRQ